MQSRLAATLVALTVIVYSGTTPTSVATLGLFDVAAGARAAPADSVGSASTSAQRSVDDAITASLGVAARLAQDQSVRAAEAAAAEVAAAAEAAAAAELAAAAEVARVQAEQIQRQAEQAQLDQAAEAARVAEALVAETTRQVQQALLTVGYSGVGAVDGIAGRRTAAAVRTFQADAGHPVTGEASAATLAQLVEKIDAGWRRPAPPPTVVSPRSVTAPTAPAPTAPAPAASAPDWTTYIANSGGQATIDLCAGGLTAYYGEGGNAIFSIPYLTIHNTCGGAPILRLSMGDTIALTGGGLDGTYQVVDSRDVSQGSTASAVAGLSGDIILQTCYFNSTTMRVVGATKIS